ncbi:MAG: hypothetical protein IT581_07470 [Verrucomicrobiales bacterium]|nr:hypothetical protein [Verrucomicrobiales bacterium]
MSIPTPRLLRAAMVLVGLLSGLTCSYGQWQVANPTPGQTFTRLVVGGDGQVAGAVFEGYALMASPNGTDEWRSQTLPKFAHGSVVVQDLTWANGKWIAASPGYIHSSTDLVNWTSSELLPTEPYVVIWNGSQFWALGLSKRMATSADAVTWTQLPNNNLAIAQPADGLWFNQRLVVVGQNLIASSSDGAAWTSDLSKPGYYFGDIQLGDGRLMAVGSDLAGTTTQIFRSTDGSTWTPLAIPPSAGGFQAVTYGNGRWLVLAYNGTVYASTNHGDSWEMAGFVPTSQSLAYRTLAFRASDNRFFFGGVGGAIASSTDGGATWKPHRQGFDASVTMLAQGGGRFVGVGNAGGTPGGIFTSVDGTRWSSNNTGFADNFISVRHLNGAFLAYSVSPRTVIHSTDGLTFTRHDPGVPIRDLVWDGTRYVGYANGNTNLYSSSDGIVWTAIPGVFHPATRTTTVGVGSFAFIDGRYLMFAQGFAGETRFFSSTDLVTWTIQILRNTPNSGYSDFVKSGNRYFLSAQQALYSSTDGATWTAVDYSMQSASTPQPAGTSLIDAGGRLYTMQYLGASTTAGQRLVYSDDGATWTLETNSFPAPFLPQDKNRLLYTGSRLVAANFAGGLFAYYDIKLGAGGNSGTGGDDLFATWIASQNLPEGSRGPADDPDQDGYSNAAEFAFGTAPGSAQAANRPSFEVGSVPVGDAAYPSVTFIRRKDIGTTTLTVEGAATADFSALRPITSLPPTDLGNGLERVTYRSDAPASGPTAFFFRVKVAGGGSA